MADEDRPKPPSIEPPKIVPGRDTARSIGIDTAFIDGLAAGLVDEGDIQPPLPPPKRAAASKPAPKGPSEGSGPLFRTPAEPEPKVDDDPLAALLPDLDAEPEPKSAPAFVAPKPKNDLLARLAAKDDDDGAVSLTAATAPPAKAKGKSEASGNVALPKGAEAPVFDPKPKAKAEPAKAEKAKRKEPAKAPPPKRERAPESAPLPAVAAAGGAFENVHPGVWFVLAAVVFGLFVPVLAGGGGQHPAKKADAARRVPATASAERGGAVAVEEEDEPALDEDAIAEDAEEEDLDEELIELEADDPSDGSKPRRKSNGDGGGKDQKSAPQLLTEAKAALSQGRNGDAYRLAGQSHRKRASDEALLIRAKAACRLGNEPAAKRAFDALPMGSARREVRPICRDKGIRLGL